MKKTYSKLKVLLGVLTFSAFIFGFAGCKNGSNDTKDDYSDPKGNGKNSTEEKPTPVTSTLGLFSAIGTSEGLKITVADNVAFMKNAGCVITVEDNPFYISITADDVDNNRKEYVFPFTKAGVEYNIVLKANLFINDSTNVEWKVDSAKCKALGGIDYSKIIDTDKIAKSTLDIAFDENNKPYYFTANYNIDIDSIEKLIKDITVFKTVGMDFTVLLGKPDWSNTLYLTNFHVDFLDENINELLKASKNGIPINSVNPLTKEWKKYDYEYNCYAILSFFLKQYPNTRFEINRIETTQKKYTPKGDSVNDNSFKVTFNEDALYGAAVFTVEDDWKSLDVTFADDTNFNDIQFNVLCDTVQSEEAWGTAYYTIYPQIAWVYNTLILEDCLNDLKISSNNPDTKITKIKIQNKTKNGFSIDVISAEVTKTNGTKVYVKPEVDWGCSVK